MALTYSFPGPSGVLDAVQARKDLAGLVARDTAGNVRAGVFPSHTGPLLVARSDMRVDVLPFAAALVRAGGPLFIANDDVAQVQLDPAPSANTRIDLIYVKQNESLIVTQEGDLPVFGVVKGNAAVSPSKPVLNVAGALEIGTVRIPSSATSTLPGQGVVLETTCAYTAAAGGRVFVRDVAQLDAWTPADGAEAYRMDLKLKYLRSGGIWRPSAVRSYSFAKGSDADGFLDVPHDLGVDPAGVSVTLQVGGGGDAITKIQGWVLWSKSSTNIRLRMIRQDTNQYLGGNPFSGIVTLNAGI